MKNALFYALVAMLAASQGFSATKQPMRRIECRTISQHIADKHLVCNGFRSRAFRAMNAAVSRQPYTATTWTGFVAAPHFKVYEKHSCRDVEGQWDAPSISIPPGVTSYQEVDIWVGMDGFFPQSQTVEQIGTYHIFAVPTGGTTLEPYHGAWYQMYPLAATTIVDFPVNPGDRIYGRVKYEGHSTFKLIIGNKTQNIWTSFTIYDSTGVGAQRGSANWVVEAPFYGSTIYPMPDFGTINFWHCKAKINGHWGCLGSKHWRHSQLDPMVDADNNVKARTSTLSENGHHFSVDFVSPGTLPPG